MQSPANRLLDELFRAIEVFGVQKTSEILRNTRTEDFFIDNEDVRFIVNMVADCFEISPKEILYGNGRKNDRVFAIGFCCFYLHYHYNYSMMQIKSFLHKDIMLCYKYTELIRDLNIAHSADKKYVGYKKKFSDLIEIRKSNIKNQANGRH